MVMISLYIYFYTDVIRFTSNLAIIQCKSYVQNNDNLEISIIYDSLTLIGLLQKYVI